MNRRAFMTGALTSPILATGVRTQAQRRAVTLYNLKTGKWVPWREAFKQIWQPSVWVQKARVYIEKEKWINSLSAEKWATIAGSKIRIP